eukprot:14366833-Ditylum_brightwellii.AAC.1
MVLYRTQRQCEQSNRLLRLRIASAISAHSPKLTTLRPHAHPQTHSTQLRAMQKYCYTKQICRMKKTQQIEQTRAYC